MIVYDVMNRTSFQNIEQWLGEIDRYASDNVTKMIVGNKCDLEARTKVPFSQLKELADSYGNFF